MKKNIIFFDVETNGKLNSSVLSMSALKISCNLETNEWIKISEFNRYYFKRIDEKLDLKALDIHGLSENIIKEKRCDCNYPLIFDDDQLSFKQFCEDTNHFVAHNINFDKTFINFKLKNEFDTMKENINIVQAGITQYGSYKWPKLKECADFYNVPFDESNLHDSNYDVLITFRVFFKMYKYTLAKNKIINFVNKN